LQAADQHVDQHGMRTAKLAGREVHRRRAAASTAAWLHVAASAFQPAPTSSWAPCFNQASLGSRARHAAITSQLSEKNGRNGNIIKWREMLNAMAEGQLLFAAISVRDLLKVMRGGSVLSETDLECGVSITFKSTPRDTIQFSFSRGRK
jgi:hypothetical protein